MQHPFFRKRLVFTGGLAAMTRAEAARRVRSVGGELQGAVSTETDFVIIGEKIRGVTSKLQQAQHLIACGAEIQILEEADFLWVLDFAHT